MGCLVASRPSVHHLGSSGRFFITAYVLGLLQVTPDTNSDDTTAIRVVALALSLIVVGILVRRKRKTPKEGEKAKIEEKSAEAFLSLNKKPIEEKIQDALLFAAVLSVWLGMFLGAAWIVVGLLNPPISPWEIARDQGWLPWTLRVEANVGQQWLPEEERTCVSITHSQEEVDALDCYLNDGGTYHNIPVQFTARRLHHFAPTKDLLSQRTWRCRKAPSGFLGSSDYFACREIKP